MRSEAIDRVRLIFDLFDANGNGVLESDDFDLMADHVVAAVPDAEEDAKAAMVAAFGTYWTTLLRELDANRDGRISFEEFKDCVLAPERFHDALEDFATSLANLGDLAGDGYVTRPVFVALMTAIGFRLPNIHALFDAFDPTEDDRILAATWLTGIQEYYAPDKAGIPGDRLLGVPVTG
ncbi:EF-hand domain-containing protein [Streptomyces sp. NBC_01497]|uniref:EF-hand domain-containing protein n=1 Tax=Streptomyces sp. NBC_01497 TaxID=2903885 RepID=UPI002E334047|nr:EF-hand domain-containing protein [Streptomyces sp. NBC_01497]